MFVHLLVEVTPLKKCFNTHVAELRCFTAW